MNNTIPFEASVTVGAEATEIVTVALEGRCERLWFDIESAGAAALVDFGIQVQVHPAAPWRDYLGGADFAAPFASGVEWVSGQAPHTLVTGQFSAGRVDVAGLWAARLVAQTAAGPATIVCRGCAK